MGGIRKVSSQIAAEVSEGSSDSCFDNAWKHVVWAGFGLQANVTRVSNQIAASEPTKESFQSDKEPTQTAPTAIGGSGS